MLRYCEGGGGQWDDSSVPEPFYESVLVPTSHNSPLGVGVVNRGGKSSTGNSGPVLHCPWF